MLVHYPISWLSLRLKIRSQIPTDGAISYAALPAPWTPDIWVSCSPLNSSSCFLLRDISTPLMSFSDISV